MSEPWPVIEDGPGVHLVYHSRKGVLTIDNQDSNRSLAVAIELRLATFRFRPMVCPRRLEALGQREVTRARPWIEAIRTISQGLAQLGPRAFMAGARTARPPLADHRDSSQVSY
ncbi:MAG: hypothetical protein BWX48_01016 [Verrucomicrobia bacterium ADurb.Bin006]|nr:MAG: hypothetical protein BWX48_01016 [Verrucomicrobia bacterium ADurb.Bin006]